MVKALPRLASGGSGCQGAQQDRDDQGSALVLPAACLFPDGKTTIGPPSRPAIDAIAAELKSAPDREFWIAVTAPARSGAASDQFTRERAAAVVNALMAAGVPPNRLAALLGPGGDAAQTPPRLAGTPLASVATVEIVAAPLPP